MAVSFDWKFVLEACRKICGPGAWTSWQSDSWCAFTTFSSFENVCRYWNCGFPDVDELGETSTIDGGLWRQSFKYSDLAHLIVPASFRWERAIDGRFEEGRKFQDLKRLASVLSSREIPFNQSEFIIEIKAY